MKMKKVLAMLLAVLMIVTATVAGTVAWLQDTTTEVKNTFTEGKVDITLDEGKVDETGKFEDGGTTRVTTNDYKMIPGNEYDKDPTVTVENDSEDCYLFVMFEEGSAKDYIDYVSTLNTDNGWTQGDGTNIPKKVWYRTVYKSDANKTWKLLQGDKITIDSTAVTKDTMNAAIASELKWTAYAIQLANTGTAAEAWAKIST